MSNPENKIDNTFNRVMEELNRLEKAFQPGKGLEKAIMSIGGDPSYLKDVAEAMSSAYEALEQAHYGAIAHLDNVDEALSKKKRITNKTPVGMVAEGVLDGADEDGFMARSQLYFLARDAITLHAQIKDQDDLEPWVQTKIAQSSKDMDAVRRYTEYSSMEQDVEPQMSPDMGDQNLPAVVPGEEVETELRPLNASAESISKSEYGLISYPDTSISYIRKTDEGNWEHIFDKSYGYEGVVDNADLKYARPIPLGKIPERMHDEALQEDWETMQPIDRDRYQEREGLEGPFMTRIGKVVYYDPKEGSYYDPDTDIYLSYEDWKELDLPNAPFRNEEIDSLDRIKDLAGIKKEDKIEEAFFLAPWILPALATAARVGGPALLKLLSKGASKSAPMAGNVAKAIVKNPGTTLKWAGAGYVFKSVYDVVEMVRDYVGDIMDNEAVETFAQIVWKYKLPAAAVIAVLYGGKKLKDYMASQEQDGEAIPETQLDEYGTISTAQPSRATIRAGKENNDVANRRSNNINQDMNRDSKVPNRTVAGANIQPTGTGASRAGSADPDDIHRQEIEDLAAQGQGQSNVNAQEIERLKQLAMGG